MNNTQIQYAINAQKSRAVSFYLERLYEEAAYHKEKLNVHSYEITQFKIKETKEELDALWDSQVDLYF